MRYGQEAHSNRGTTASGNGAGTMTLTLIISLTSGVQAATGSWHVQSWSHVITNTAIASGPLKSPCVSPSGSLTRFRSHRCFPVTQIVALGPLGMSSHHLRVLLTLQASPHPPGSALLVHLSDPFQLFCKPFVGPGSTLSSIYTVLYTASGSRNCLTLSSSFNLPQLGH